MEHGNLLTSPRCHRLKYEGTKTGNYDSLIPHRVLMYHEELFLTPCEQVAPARAAQKGSRVR